MSGYSIDTAPLVATLITTIVLYFKFVICSWKQDLAAKAAGLAPKENTSGFAKKNEETKFSQVGDKEKSDKERAQRWNRIVSNDLEQIPLALFIGWASIPAAHDPVAHTVFISAFGVLRILHTLSFVYELQPYRSYTWMLAIVCVLGMIINTFIGCAYL
eukprot:c18006_g1_i1.p1 GENE.c18006_g1_i1~~c18006_g1_i1.p1  ORF type:complete len:159 (-),score=47.05 c18006_g1_i1:23-499(-)